MVLPYLNWASEATSATLHRAAGTAPDHDVALAVDLQVVDGRLELLGGDLQQRLAGLVAAAITALPTRCVARLANVPMSCGPVSVSAVSMTTSSNATPSVSAAIWPITVFRPWPRSVVERETTNEPLVVAWTSACDGSPPRFMPVG